MSTRKSLMMYEPPRSTACYGSNTLRNKDSTRMTPQQLVRLMTASSIAPVLTGCSIIDPEKISGLHQLAVWQYESERLAPLASEQTEQMYNKASDEIRAYIDVTLDAEINDVAGSPVGAINLRKERIPPTVATAVEQFKTSAGRVHKMEATDVLEIIKDVSDWAHEKIKESRKACADELRKKLQSLKWKDWSSVRSGQ